MAIKVPIDTRTIYKRLEGFDARDTADYRKIEEFVQQPTPRWLDGDILKIAYVQFAAAAGSRLAKLFAFIFAALFLVMPLIFFPWGLPAELLIEAGWAETTRAKITLCEKTRASEGGNSKRRKPGTPIYRVHAAFDGPDGRRVVISNFYTGVNAIPGWLAGAFDASGRPKAEMAVSARYFPLFPSWALLPGGRLSRFSGFSVMVGIFPVIMAVFLAVELKKRRRIRILLQQGEAVAAEVAAVDRGNVRVNKRTRYKVTFRYFADGGMVESKKYAYGREVVFYMDCMDQKKKTRVLYMPGEPEKMLAVPVVVEENGTD